MGMIERILRSCTSTFCIVVLKVRFTWRSGLLFIHKFHDVMRFPCIAWAIGVSGHGYILVACREFGTVRMLRVLLLADRCC
jgi:hypothetical protein